jgi:hypothetical protein
MKKYSFSYTLATSMMSEKLIFANLQNKMHDITLERR